MLAEVLPRGQMQRPLSSVAATDVIRDVVYSSAINSHQCPVVLLIEVGSAG